MLEWVVLLMAGLLSLASGGLNGPLQAIDKGCFVSLMHELMSCQEGSIALILPSLNGLRAFEAAARQLSFTRAAAELNVTQTAISHQIRRLEEQLGISLFERRTRELRLTREAVAYLPAVQGAFEELRQATARLRRPAREGMLTVSTPASLAAKWLVTRVATSRTPTPVSRSVSPRPRTWSTSGARRSTWRCATGAVTGRDCARDG